MAAGMRNGRDPAECANRRRIYALTDEEQVCPFAASDHDQKNQRWRQRTVENGRPERAISRHRASADRSRRFRTNESPRKSRWSILRP